MYNATAYNSSENVLLGCLKENLQSRNLHMEYDVRPTDKKNKNRMSQAIYMFENGFTLVNRKRLTRAVKNQPIE